MSILGAIANPQMADIAGALDARQDRLDRDEARRKEIRAGQLIAEALPNIKQGSALHELATNSPQQFALVAKALGVPLNAGDQLQELTDDVANMYTRAQADPSAALEYAHVVKDQRNKAGRETPQLDKFLAAAAQDPATAMTGLFVMHRALNREQDNTPAGLREFEGMTQGLSDEERDQARRVQLGIAPRAVGSAAMTTATTGMTDVVADSEGRIAGTVEGSKKTAGGNVTRKQDFITTGVSAAEAIPNMRRALTLLDSVKTGGFNAVAARARQTMGIEGADEGELSSNLGKAVLSQLRETFGAAFTEKEGERLERIEAGFGRNADANRRILGQALQLLESKAERGIKAAEEQGDDFAIQDIRKYLEMSLDPVSDQPAGETRSGATSRYKIEVLD